jgi:hypothetical protein
MRVGPGNQKAIKATALEFGPEKRCMRRPAGWIAKIVKVLKHGAKLNWLLRAIKADNYSC